MVEFYLEGDSTLIIYEFGEGDTTYTAKLGIESIRGLKVPAGVYLYKEDSIAQVSLLKPSTLM